jgi:hypothetical protein
MKLLGLVGSALAGAAPAALALGGAGASVAPEEPQPVAARREVLQAWVEVGAVSDCPLSGILLNARPAEPGAASVAELR